MVFPTMCTCGSYQVYSVSLLVPMIIRTHSLAFVPSCFVEFYYFPRLKYPSGAAHLLAVSLLSNIQYGGKYSVPEQLKVIYKARGLPAADRTCVARSCDSAKSYISSANKTSWVKRILLLPHNNSLVDFSCELHQATKASKFVTCKHHVQLQPASQSAYLRYVITVTTLYQTIENNILTWHKVT
jgi:hypothetical protein